MQKRQLGTSGIEVTDLCLGSMTWGTQNTTAEGHDQIDRALDAGINFIDTAEMYPVNPVNAETTGHTEEIIGQWLERSSRRADVVLATKHSGAGLQHVRDGAPITSKTIPEAIEGSLRRLRTDHIDLYQFHWPNRGSYMFRQNWHYDPSGQNRADTIAHMQDAIGALQKEMERGTIRAFGLSNESAWGVALWSAVAQRMGGPRPVGLQNEYSMLCRVADTDVAEACVNEEVGFLAFSPLAAGFLTGKYQHDTVPEGSRMSLVPEMGGRKTARTFRAVGIYEKIAENHGLDLTQMALAWARQRPWMTSVIFGATTMAQLELALGAADLMLPDDVLSQIDAAHMSHPMPY